MQDEEENLITEDKIENTVDNQSFSLPNNISDNRSSDINHNSKIRHTSQNINKKLICLKRPMSTGSAASGFDKISPRPDSLSGIDFRVVNSADQLPIRTSHCRNIVKIDETVIISDDKVVQGLAEPILNSVAKKN